MNRATGLPWPGPITTPLFFALGYSLPLPLPLNPSFPLSVLPMNVSISLVMCKLFSPALQADGLQCLCLDFLCMSFLISKRVRRFPCFLLEKGELAHIHYTHTHTHTCSLTDNLQSICMLCCGDIGAVVAVTGFITGAHLTTL